MQQKIFITIGCMFIAFICKAQTAEKELSKESFATQLKNGTAPGLKYAPTTTALNPKEVNMKEPKNETMELRNGLGEHIKKAGNGGIKAKPAAADKKAVGVASEKKVVMVKDSIVIPHPLMQETPKP